MLLMILGSKSKLKSSSLVLMLFFTTSIGIISCGSQKKLAGDSLAIFFQKGGCFGSCPVYTMSIDQDGLVN